MARRTYDYKYLIDLYQSGWTAPDIARLVGCHKQTVYTALDKAGVERRDDRVPPVNPRLSVCGRGHPKAGNVWVSQGKETCKTCHNFSTTIRRFNEGEQR